MCMSYLQLYAWNNASRAYKAVTILCFKFIVHVMLFPMIENLHFPISTLRNMCAMPSAAVLCSSLISFFIGMLDILWMILRWIQLFLLLLVSPLVVINIIFLIWQQNKWLHTPRTTDYRHTRQDRWIQTELAFTLAKNATEPNPFEVISLQTTRKEKNWKTEEALAQAAVTLETERIKGPNPWCLWWWWSF